jgi:ATP-dependent exoDNAse (exonuclease V) beta subunit
MTMGTDNNDDRAVRRRALSAAESFIVQAPAGSGKTELLIQRCLNLLAHVREPEEIVAITFTRKAAGEMRERVMAALRRARAGEAPADEVDRDRLALARRAVDNDRRHGWDLVSHPARLQIQTIDALCLSLTRQLPYLSGFAAPSGLMDEPDAAYRRAAADAVRLLGDGDRGWRDDLERFLIHVDNDMARATGLLTAMLASRDQWLRYLGDERMSAQGLETAWRNLVDDYLLRIDAAFPTSMKASLAACADAAAGELAAQDAPGAAAWLAGEGFPPPAAEALPRWRFLAGLLVT